MSRAPVWMVGETEAVIEAPETKYAVLGEDRLADQVFGHCDLALVCWLG